MSNFLEETGDVRQHFVRPVYLSLLHANFAQRPDLVLRQTGNSDCDQAAICKRIATCASKITDEQITELLSIREWRGRLAAGWFVGLSNRVAFVNQIGALLLDSELTYAGQGFCVALGLIGGDTCRHHLRAYLSRYLPVLGRYYDQEWAIGALAHIERDLPPEYLLPEIWADAQNRMNPSDSIQRFSNLVRYLDQQQMRGRLDFSEVSKWR